MDIHDDIEIGKWGNSAALRIPAKIAAKAGLRPGVRVRLTVEGDQLVLTPPAPRKRAKAQALKSESLGVRSKTKKPSKTAKNSVDPVAQARAALSRIPKRMSAVDDFLAWRKTQWDDHYA
jgi:antitoxin component of MazEF toxin-antitoxin module